MFFDHHVRDRQHEVRKRHIAVATFDPVAPARAIDEERTLVGHHAAYFRPRREKPRTGKALAVERDDAEPHAFAEPKRFQARQDEYPALSR